MSSSPASCEVLSFCGAVPCFASVRSEVVLQSDRLRVVRIALAAGASLKEHTAPGDLLVQCLQGKVSFNLPLESHILESGQLIHVPDRLPHAVEAIEDAQLLLTIALDP